MMLFESDLFEPTAAAARARLDAVRPAAYARTRNALDGAVTRLSPYITHGLLTLPEVLGSLLRRGPLPVQQKLVYELGWREYFQHVRLHRGDGIFESLHVGPLPDDAYASEVPVDVREANCGVPAIDAAVRELYATGWLHNHARMWLASYLVHLRKVHWRAGADWLYGHLLDGDLASNHLSWQWVAGTASHKPYLFNAENVARYAPLHWHSRGSVIDTSYEELDSLSHSPHAVAGRAAGGKGATAEPTLLNAPPAGLGRPPDTADVAGKHVFLLHAWSPVVPPNNGRQTIGIVDTEFHSRWPWSAARWRFVAARWQQAGVPLWCGTAGELLAALGAAASVEGSHDHHLAPVFSRLALTPPPSLLPWPDRRCDSFSQFWTRSTRGLHDAAELLPAFPA